MHLSARQSATEHRHVEVIPEHASDVMHSGVRYAVRSTKHDEQPSDAGFPPASPQQLFRAEFLAAAIEEQRGESAAVAACFVPQLLGHILQQALPRSPRVAHADATVSGAQMPGVDAKDGAEHYALGQNLLLLRYRPTVKAGEMEVHASPGAQHGEPVDVTLEASALGGAHAKRHVRVVEAPSPAVRDGIAMVAHPRCPVPMVEVPTLVPNATPIDNAEPHHARSPLRPLLFRTPHDGDDAGALDVTATRPAPAQGPAATLAPAPAPAPAPTSRPRRWFLEAAASVCHDDNLGWSSKLLCGTTSAAPGAARTNPAWRPPIKLAAVWARMVTSARRATSAWVGAVAAAARLALLVACAPLASTHMLRGLRSRLRGRFRRRFRRRLRQGLRRGFRQGLRHGLRQGFRRGLRQGLRRWL
mmetsp:Transcript_22447/g.62787  ORF Transcript_22447/g.62787 Transcript_22447/m.62787 type:complete len:416 (-) Transcript_22447:435-1682(-)